MTNPLAELDEVQLHNLREFILEDNTLAEDEARYLVKDLTRELCDRTLSRLMAPIVKEFIKEREGTK